MCKPPSPSFVFEHMVTDGDLKCLSGPEELYLIDSDLVYDTESRPKGHAHVVALSYPF